MAIRTSATTALPFSLAARRHSAGKASHAVPPVTVGVGPAQDAFGGVGVAAPQRQPPHPRQRCEAGGGGAAPGGAPWRLIGDDGAHELGPGEDRAFAAFLRNGEAMVSDAALAAADSEDERG